MSSLGTKWNLNICPVASGIHNQQHPLNKHHAVVWRVLVMLKTVAQGEGHLPVLEPV